MRVLATRLLLSASLGLMGCTTPAGPGAAGADPATIEATAPGDDGAATTDEASAAPQRLLAHYRFDGDPVKGSWDLQRVDAANDEALPPGIGRVAGALANGDEAVQVTFGSQASLQNCAAGQCGCNAGSPDFDLPTWYSNDSCLTGQRVAYGRVRLTNNTSTSYFQNPSTVFVARTPASLRFFSTFPSAPFNCGAYSPRTRTASPYSGAVYSRYNDIGPGACDRGVDTWVAAATAAPDVNAPVSFDIFVYVDTLVPNQVPNGAFSSGLANWTVSGSAEAVAEHCSHASDYTCGGGEDGVLPPSGSGTMARVLTVDGAATPAYTGSLTSTAFLLQASMPNLSFQYKAGSREAASFCLAANVDEFYVQARRNGGSWITLPLPNPPDTNSDARLGTVVDCASFQRIDLAAVFENSWYPGSPGSPQAWATAVTNLTSAPLSAVAGDLIELRFWTVSGAPSPQLGASALLLDNVQMVP
ncbi:MAG: hypothetical protein IPL40_07760 [Proteobacteria bacterium]|nr:hypothetical protein [Pseudomonadota bacterium]